MTDNQVRTAIKRLESREKLKDIAYDYKVHPWTLTRNINRLEAETVS